MEQRHTIACCRVCKNEFDKTRSDRLACSNTCNVRLHRLRKKANRVEELTVLDELKNIIKQLVIDVQNLKQNQPQENPQ